MADTLGDRIRERRKQIPGFRDSQQALADAVGVQREQVSHWERGKHEPGATNIAKLARVLDTTVEWLQYGEPPAGTEGNDEVETARQQITRAVHLLFSALEKLPHDAIATVGTATPTPRAEAKTMDDEALGTAEASLEGLTEQEDGGERPSEERGKRRKRGRA